MPFISFLYLYVESMLSLKSLRIMLAFNNNKMVTFYMYRSAHMNGFLFES